MFKSLMIASSIALSAFAMTTGAEAKTRVGIYFGVPFYDYQVGPGWRYHDGYGWYDYGRYGDFRRHQAADAPDALQIGHRGAAEFHHKPGQGDRSPKAKGGTF